MRFSRYSFRKLRKLWLIYLFLLFFSFFMFIFTINLYLQNLEEWEIRKRNWEQEEKRLKDRISNKNIEIVAHYIGSGNLFGNLSKEEYNTNDFNGGDENEGAYGRPVLIPSRDSFRMQKLFKINSFNLLASDRIPLNRTLKDYRIRECQAKIYPKDLPDTSVIIVFHNEAWSVLLRTVWSVINRSPKHLIKEIILVDDASDRDYLQEELVNYVAKLPITVRIKRLSERSGLVTARLLGAKNAIGEVLTFLDAHCECTEGWLEPLLARIKENRTTVIQPVIDIISDDNFGYTKTIENNWGAFNWELHFRWFVIGLKEMQDRSDNPSKTISTPGMAGGLFCIDKKYFYEMGAYDPGMKIWGGENVEMSFRIWQCGGRIEIHPCSHVGHLFRRQSPYTFPGGMKEVLSENLGRAALVWMDKWTDFFFLYGTGSLELKKTLNVTDRINLRKELKCKPFSWYLNEVWPTHFFPTDERFFGKIVWLNDKTTMTEAYSEFVDEIKKESKVIPATWSAVFQNIWQYAYSLLKNLNLDQDSCLRTNFNETIYGTMYLTSAVVQNCNPHERMQDTFVITPTGMIMTNDNVCLDSMERNPDNGMEIKMHDNGTNVRFFHCYDFVRQYWTYNFETQQIRHKKWKSCLTVDNTRSNGLFFVKTAPCEKGINKFQRWALIPMPWTTK